MTDVSKYINRSTLFRNFLFEEIVKRHVEEFDHDCLIQLNKIKDSLCSDHIHKDNIFITVIGIAIDVYNLSKQDRRCDVNPTLSAIMEKDPKFFDFQNPVIKYNYDKLIDISNKYNIHAPNLLYPIDMGDIINNASDDFIPPTSQPFNNTVNGKFKFFMLGGQLVAELNNNLLNEEDAKYILFQFLNYRINHGNKISELERKFYNSIRGEAKEEKFRIDSFIKHIVGMHIWDSEKKYNNHDSIYDLYRKYKKKQRSCGSNDSCKNSCPSFDTCDKFVRESRRFASIEIQKRQILSTVEKGNLVKPKKDSSILRYPIQFYYNGDYNVNNITPEAVISI